MCIRDRGLTKRALFQNFGNDILKTVIPKSITITEAEFYGKPTMLFDVKSSGSVAYLNLANELMNKDLNACDGFLEEQIQKSPE